MLKKLKRKFRRGASKEKNHTAGQREIMDPVQLYRYEDDGVFDYYAYRSMQVEGNKAKIDSIWADEKNIKFISKYLSRERGVIKFGLCHGTRRGLEQKWFKKYLGCDVLGTEISDTADQFDDTIEWDFHEVKDEWIGSVDFIYSNSFDHSYDPRACINAWADCLKEGGICVIEHGSDDEVANNLDPFGAKAEIMPYLLVRWLGGKCGVIDVVDAPVLTHKQSYLLFIILQKRKSSNNEGL